MELASQRFGSSRKFSECKKGPGTLTKQKDTNFSMKMPSQFPQSGGDLKTWAVIKTALLLPDRLETV